MKHTNLHKLRAFTRGSLLRRHRGFTLMEMILVIGIIALLVGAGVVGLVGVMDTGREGRAKADINTLMSALRMYETKSGLLPTSAQGLNALVERPSGSGSPANWSPVCKAKNLIDPWKNPYQYRRPGTQDKSGFDVFSMGPDGQAGTADDIGSWQL